MSSVIVSGARTPIGSLLGSLSTLTAMQLGGVAITAALEKARFATELVEHVFMGQVLTAGCGQLPARQAAVLAGIPMTVPSTTISKVCLSGLQSIIIADQAIRAGDLEVVIAGGMESMSQAPHLLKDSRKGFTFGSATLDDHMALDGLEDAFDGGTSMGLLAESRNDLPELHVSRQEQDEFAARSHQLAVKGWKSGAFADEVVPVEVPQRKGAARIVDRDERPRPDTTAEVLGRLSPAFRSDGTITAGSSSPISDGASALLVMDRDRAAAEGLSWLAEIVGSGMVAGPDQSLQHQPADAISRACERSGIAVSALDLIEINEAFAAVVLASATKLGVPLEKVNVNGGAIALGHPIGMSGNRLVLHLVHELRRRGGGIGAVGLCGGGGQGDAVVIKVEPSPN